MINMTFQDTNFFKDMNNVMQYSEGYLEGIHKGKTNFLKQIGEDTIKLMKQFIDQQARADHQMYHHIYEWYQTGNPEARLYEILFEVNGGGLSLNGELTQSKSIQDGSHTPFYNKARIMEEGIPVRIKPKRASVLAFTVGDQKVFTKNEVLVNDPGGTHVVGSFENIFKLFIEQHFRQSVLESTGIAEYLRTSNAYKNNLQSGKTGGKSVGIDVGYNWITRAGGING
jgi:hypothetical protein